MAGMMAGTPQSGNVTLSTLKGRGVFSNTLVREMSHGRSLAPAFADLPESHVTQGKAPNFAEDWSLERAALGCKAPHW